MPAGRATIFDLDGTLVDSRQAVVAAVIRGVRETAQAHGVDFSPSADAVVAALGLPALSYFRRLLPDELAPLAQEALLRSTHYEVAAMHAGGGALFAGVLEGLRDLRAAGWRVGIISNAQSAYFHAALTSLELDASCDHAMCQEELPTATVDTAPTPPKQRLLELALARLDCVAAASWMMGDRAEDLHAGRALGLRSAAASYGFGSAQEHAGADLRCASFPEFTRALLGRARFSL